MKTLLLLLLFAFVVLNAQAGAFTIDTTGKACKRTVTHIATPRLAPTDVKFISTAACRFGGKAGAAAAVAADINVVGRPDMSIGVFHVVGANSSDYSAGLSSFRIVLERIIEYSDVDGVPGYQPQIGGDWPCGNGITLLANLDWSSFQLSTDTDNSGNTLYSLTSIATTTSSTITYSLAVQMSTVSMTNNKTRLDPSSFKFTFDVNNYVYKNASCASGLAFKVLIVSRGQIREKLATTTVNTDIDLSTQDTYDIPDANGNTVGTFFAWDKYVTDVNNGTIYVLHSNISKLASDVSEATGLDVPANWRAAALWYSVSGQVTDLSWDPYALADDSVVGDDTGDSSSTTGRTSSSSTVVVELLFIIITTVAILL